MLLFIGSEAFFFLALIISYVFYSHPGGILASTAKYLDIKKTSIFTFFLLASSLSMELVIINKHRLKRTTMFVFLLITILLGAIFLIGQFIEYAKLYSSNVTVSGNVFGSSFFILTGFHGFHVFVGLIFLSVVFAMFMSKKFISIESTALSSAAVYWHFVDVVWVIVFSVVYIGSAL